MPEFTKERLIAAAPDMYKLTKILCEGLSGTSTEYKNELLRITCNEAKVILACMNEKETA